MRKEIIERIEKIRNGEIPEGYGVSKIGIIPKDWRISKLKSKGEFFKGKGIPRKDISECGEPCIRYGEIYTHYKEHFTDTISKVSKKKAKNSKLIIKGDVLFTGSGETPEEIGKCTVFLGSGKCYCGGDIIVFRPKPNEDSKFLGYLMNSNIINNQKYRMAQGNSVVHIYSSNIRNLIIPDINSKEQKKIAYILTTWDKAIEKKEELLEKKKQLKKGLMQRLLTGELRLPGFDGEWKEVKIRDIAKLQGGNGFPKKYQGKKDLSIPFYKVSDMNNIGNEVFMKKANNYVGRKIVDKINISIFPENSIIFAKVGAALLLNRRRILSKESAIDNNLMGLICSKRANYEFVYSVLCRVDFARYVNPGAVPSINQRQVGNIKLNLPSLEEQKAIAEVLSTADKSIELIEKQIENLKLQKKGLMQLLLTGIVRVNELDIKVE